MKKSVILASNSPRRKELLSMLGIEFEVIADNTPENVEPGLPPEKVVCELARFKGENVISTLESRTDGLVIAADTVVSVDGRILGKPKTEEEAFKMLSLLSGRQHNVYTGVFVKDICTKKFEVFCEKTEVFFKKLDIIEIKDYINTGESMDKAGAYGIQNFGALFVEKIYGDYFNVVGLPICKLGKILNEEFSFRIF